MDFDCPLFTGLRVSVDFLVVFLFDQLVPVAVQRSDEGIQCRRSRNCGDNRSSTSRYGYCSWAIRYGYGVSQDLAFPPADRGHVDPRSRWEAELRASPG